MTTNLPSKEPLLGARGGHGHGKSHDHGHETGECHQHAHGSGCESTGHSPGMCHGFETSKKGNWVEVHDENSLDALFNPTKNSDANRTAITSLGAATVAVFVLMVLEAICGYLSGSLALVSDAAHQLSDVILYGGLLVSVRMSTRTGNVNGYSFGYHRAQVLGAMMALLSQYFITGLIVAEAMDRLSGDQQSVDGMTICIMASFALCTNLVLLRVMPASGHGHSHGGSSDGSAGKVAYLHVLTDLLQGTICTIVGAIIWIHPESAWLDSASAFCYAATVVCSTYKLFKEFVHVLMERTPIEMNTTELFNDLARIKGVIDVHCCHVWMIAPEKIAMSAHIHIEDDLHEDVLHAAQIVLKHKYGIIHSTIQVSEDEDLA